MTGVKLLVQCCKLQIAFLKSRDVSFCKQFLEEIIVNFHFKYLGNCTLFIEYVLGPQVGFAKLNQMT